MSGLSLPVNRPVGRALLVAGAANRGRPTEILQGLGFGSTNVEDPYAAMAELCQRPLVYRAVILSLASMYREELAIIPAIKSRFPHIELWLAHTDGRQAALAESMRLGADGLLAEDGLHRIAAGIAPATQTPATMTWPESADSATESDATHASNQDAAPVEAPQPLAIEPDACDPILTQAELRALLHEHSAVPPGDD